MARFPNVRDALLRYDPAAKMVTAITALGNGAFRVDYIDKERKPFSFTYRSNDNA